MVNPYEGSNSANVQDGMHSNCCPVCDIRQPRWRCIIPMRQCHECRTCLAIKGPVWARVVIGIGATSIVLGISIWSVLDPDGVWRSTRPISIAFVALFALAFLLFGRFGYVVPTTGRDTCTEAQISDLRDRYQSTLQYRRGGSG